MSGTSSPEAVKKLLENTQGDLRGLSLECRKKFPPVKEVRDSVKTRTHSLRTTAVIEWKKHEFAIEVDIQTTPCVFLHFWLCYVMVSKSYLYLSRFTLYTEVF
uniref:Uncharacterized protein n=1 Tax=Gopherus agassizii TaxID=38772 RepID=A0A452H0I7_9SAUR